MQAEEQITGPVAVFGAAGAVGEAIVRTLKAGGHSVRPVSRRPQALAADLGCCVGADLNDPASVVGALMGASAAVFVPVLTLSVNALPALAEAGVSRAVFFSSNNLAVKAADPAYASLAAAEEALRQSAVAWTILRPTLIYGDPRLVTMARLLQMARRFPVLASPGLGLARQQPIFHEDLAAVAAWSVTAPETHHTVLPLGGPEVMPLHELYAAASCAAGGTGLVAPIPFAALRLAKRILGPRFPLDDAQLARIQAEKHVTEPVSLPEEVRPRTPLAEGLARLLSALDQNGAQAPSSQARSAP